MINIDIHADDYALTINASKDILDCLKAGKLDSISIICNMPCFDECMNMLYDAIPSLPYLPLISVHIDLIEGNALANNHELLSKNNLISLSWKDVFFMSFTAKKHELKRELKQEIQAQIDKVWNVTKKCIEIAKHNNIPYSQKGLRIDSHQHIHELPLVFESIIEVVEENCYELEYIRNSKEPLIPFLKAISLYPTYSPINFVKNRLLMFYSPIIDKYCEKHNIQKMYMWGLVMSGNMNSSRIDKVFPSMYKKTQKDDRTLEILFHPGLSLDSEKCEQIPESSMNEFYLSKNRHIEKDSVLKFIKPNSI